jgi:hypothetical protein
MMGQYPFAAVVGKVIDVYGPWACSLTASFLFAAGFGVFATEIEKTPDDIIAPSNTSFRVLAACFFILGLGTVSSYVTTLSISTPSYPDTLYTKAIFRLSLQHLGLSPNTWAPRQGQAWHSLACLLYSSLSWHLGTSPAHRQGWMSSVSCFSWHLLLALSTLWVPST